LKALSCLQFRIICDPPTFCLTKGDWYVCILGWKIQTIFALIWHRRSLTLREEFATKIAKMVCRLSHSLCINQL
jgi:hypothetical protein